MSLGQALLDLVLPRWCVRCGAAREDLCALCAALITVRTTAPRIVSVPGGPDLSVVSPLVATDDLLRVVTAYKDEGRRALASSLVGLARLTGFAAGSGTVVIVPQTRRAYRRRGWHPLGVLARRWGYHPESALAFVRSPREQSQLGRAERFANLAGTMRVKPSWRGPNGAVVLFDDVVTTGATLAEAARALRAAGLTCVSALTLGSVPTRTLGGALNSNF